MWAGWTRVAVVTSLMLCQVSASACSAGWFGKMCQLKCHCAQPSCDMAGNCPDNTCAPGYFGPGCQYVDVGFNKTVPTTLSYLTDDSDSTCNPASDSARLSLHYISATPFSWIRIRVNNERTITSFSVKLNDHNTPCRNEKKYVLDSKTVDVTCDLPPLLKVLIIDGSVAGSICSIHITAGRNVALQHNTQQSSDMYASTQSSAAVDGSITSCSATRPDAHPSWSLNFHRAHLIYKARVHITHRNRQSLVEFSLILLLANGATKIASFANANSAIPTVYEIPFSADAFVTSVKIELSAHANRATRSLALCEVELYGETVCPDKRYGLECHLRCACNGSDICNSVTGVCVPGCPFGMFGIHCRSHCSRQCLRDQCHNRLGECVECPDGFEGDYCTIDCEPGTYGPRCVFNCSQNCFDLCNYQSGYCSCKPPYTGLKCTECRTGSYGPNCTLSCSKLCKNKCHVVTGQCLTCLGNRFGELCEAQCVTRGRCRTKCDLSPVPRDRGTLSPNDPSIALVVPAPPSSNCPAGYYGSSCLRKCSEHCANHTCDNNNGTCSVCVGGYTGPTCTGEPEKTQWWLTLLIVFSVLVAVIFCSVSAIICLSKNLNPAHCLPVVENTLTEVTSGTIATNAVTSVGSESTPSPVSHALSLRRWLKPATSATTVAADDDVGTQVDGGDDDVGTQVDGGDDEVGQALEDLDEVQTQIDFDDALTQVDTQEEEADDNQTTVQ